jgi:cytochrome c
MASTSTDGLIRQRDKDIDMQGFKRIGRSRASARNVFVASAVCMVATTLLGPIAAHASEELARAKGCLACHSVDTKVVGPAYKDVAAKYAGQADAENKLVTKVLKGSTGVWGFVPMPPNAGVSEEEAHVLVKWILSRAKPPAP